MKLLQTLLFIVLLAISSGAQIKITSTEKIHIPAGEHWFQAVYSPTGKDIYLTNQGYNGIWKYSIQENSITEITRDAGSGFNFVVSQDEKQIAYRRTLQSSNSMQRTQEIVEKNLSTMEEKVITTGDDLQTPVFIKNTLSYTNLRTKKTILPASAVSAIAVLGIEDQKIILAKNGKKEIFDPLPNGRYIWPALSPDQSKLVAVEMDRGAFIVSIDGKNIVRIRRCNAPIWSRSGNWVIGMEDIDNGHTIIGSEIIAVSADGKTKLHLTETTDRMEMYPSCSPTENKILVTTSVGEVFMLTYEEGK